MKQRMRNVFTSILKNKYLSELATQVGYAILSGIYFIQRLFLHRKSKYTLQQSREIMQKTSKKPDMESEIINREISKDLSIIVPAYNAEKTIIECIQSVITQETRYNYELIIINDGSKDNTQNMVESIADTHIRLINQENRGFSGARNRGIDESIGRYIMFLDSDDLLVDNCIENMIDKAVNENADIVQAGYYSFTGQGKSNIQKNILQDCVVENNRKKIVHNPGFPWAKVYKREMFNQVRFPLDVWFEDTIVCMILYRMCNKMVIMKDIVYGYRINPNGITKTARYNNKCIDHYWVMEYVIELSQKLKLPNDEIQYQLVIGHMSTLLYRRISLMDKQVIESTFIAAAQLLDEIRPQGYVPKGNLINKDIEKAFRTRNYKLWKAASFIV